MRARDLDQPIAVGGTAEVYAWEPGWVLKLYFERYETGIAEFEHRIASAICATGLPVPAVGEIVNVSGRAGLLYQKCEGESMGDDLAKHPWRVISYARTLAELQAEMHAKPIQADLAPLRRRLAHKIQEAKPLPEDLRTTALKALEAMPDGDRLCHGDFHPGNILLSRPEPIIIDWIDASIGSPLADVARTSILARGLAAIETQAAWTRRFGIRLLHAVYLHRYFQLRPGRYDEYRRWLPIVAAARLSEGVAGWENWLLAQAGGLLPR
ncbi:MAG: phosphotransferase [Anaerolineales bacterium]|nr:phosphotransferase [Anaerolineales bacterium]